MSRQWQVEESFGLEQLKQTSSEVGSPRRRQVKVRLRACSLNYRDLLVVRGEYDPRFVLPLVPLSDGAGEVIAVGEDVYEWKQGDRVMGCFAPDWQGGTPTKDMLRNTRGAPGQGMLQEMLLTEADGLVRVPAHLTDEEAATLPCATLTAWTALQGVRAGETVLVQGTGGVSIAALQLAQAMGARVVVTSSQQVKLERARELGAWQTIDYRAETRWGKRVADEWGGADRVIEVGGAATIEQSLRAVKPGGVISSVGILSGAKAEIALTRLFMNGITLRGILVGSRDDFRAMNAAIKAHTIHPVVDRVFDFDQAPEAFAYLARGAHFGKVCIRLP